MKRLLVLCMIWSIAIVVGLVNPAAADEKTMKQGPYMLVEGKVTEVSARLLSVDGQQYPVSMFARVYVGSEKGQEIPMHTIVAIGRIDKARLLLLGGKVEKIIVLENI